MFLTKSDFIQYEFIFTNFFLTKCVWETDSNASFWTPTPADKYEDKQQMLFNSKSGDLM